MKFYFISSSYNDGNSLDNYTKLFENINQIVKCDSQISKNKMNLIYHVYKHYRN